MAQAGILILSTIRPRRQGQTKTTIYQSLHGHRVPDQNSKCKDVKTLEQEEIDINARPQDSSDEDVFAASDYGETSDTSDSEFQDKPRPCRQDPTLPPASPTPEKQPNPDDAKREEFESHPSPIIGHKRKAEQLDEDETAVNMSFNLEPKKGQKRTAGYGKTRSKPQEKTTSKPLDVKQSKESIRDGASPGAKKEADAFIRFPTESLLANLEKHSPHAKSPNSSSPPSTKEPDFKRPQLSGQAPETLDPKAGRRKGRKLSQKAKRSGDASSRELKPISSGSSKLNSAAPNDSAIMAARKLGLDESTFKVPSSLPSPPSPSDKAYASSGFSTPHTSLNDNGSLIECKASLFDDDFSDGVTKPGSAPSKLHIPKCPMCKATVDNLFLESFTKNRRLTIREQAKFCQAHQRRTADEEWEAKRYPTIDWSCLHMQVKIHSEAINEIFKGGRFSYYRNAYDDFLKREKHKTLKQSLLQGGGIEDFSPGYYGSRGARIMIDNLMSNFASQLRRRSSSDQLISARGVTNYVRAVLVPELATLLVMDDMNIGAEEARKVLRESVELGNVINEEQDEVIKDPEMDEI